MIEVRGLSKTFGATKAVDNLTFNVKPGMVTGFLGPNGAGKSTTMRMILGLDRPTAGSALIDGKPYSDLVQPLRTVGALLDAKWVHPNRSARAHLQWMAASNSLPKSRVDEVLHLVGLTEVAGKKAGGFSLGMSQRLGLAATLLGDPKVLLFDEPVNGLDPEASSGSGSSCSASPPRAAPCWCRATCCPRWRSPQNIWWSSAAGV